MTVHHRKPTTTTPNEPRENRLINNLLAPSLSDRVNNDLNKCSQKIRIENSIVWVRWKNVEEAAKVLQGLKSKEKKMDSLLYKISKNQYFFSPENNEYIFAGYLNDSIAVGHGSGGHIFW